MAIVAKRMSVIRPSATVALNTKALELKAAGRGRYRSGRRRTRLRHAGKRCGGGHRRNPGRGHQVHRARRASRAEGRDRAQAEARERPRLRARAGDRRQRRQACPVQRLHGEPRSRRRGGHPRALLDQLPRDGAALRRRTRDRPMPGRGRLQDGARPAGGRNHPQNQMGAAQQPEQPPRAPPTAATR